MLSAHEADAHQAAGRTTAVSDLAGIAERISPCSLVEIGPPGIIFGNSSQITHRSKVISYASRLVSMLLQCADGVRRRLKPQSGD